MLNAMNITGANPIHLADTQTSGQPGEFRLNQRISADILKVSGDQVTMVVQGQQVVGRIAGGDQTSLAGQKTAQFIVRGMADGVLQLQIVPTDAGQTASSSLSNQWSILAQNLLQLNGLPISEENMAMGRALLGAGLPITSQLINTMQSALSGIANWGQTEADMSASLLSNGLPLSTGSLSLALQNLPSLIDSFQKLQGQLETLLKSSSSAETRSLAGNALQILNSTTINSGETSANIMAQVRNSIAILGKPLEAHLADALKNNTSLQGNNADANGLLSLAYLRRQMLNEGNNSVVREIDHFMNSLRQMQFLNTASPRDPTNPPWLVVNLPLAAQQSQNQPNLQNANIKISYRADENGKEIDPDNNRIVFTVELEKGHNLEVDLSMVQKRVGAWLTAPDDEWKSLIESELSTLKDGLESIGYQMQFARCETKAQTSVIDTSIVNRVNIEA
jgi:hypothetical protein